jgi:hypothetical protein
MMSFWTYITGFFYALWTFADFEGTIPAWFGLIWFSGFRGEDLNVIFYQNMPNLHNRYESAERKISQKNPKYMLNCSLPFWSYCPFYLTWPKAMWTFAITWRPSVVRRKLSHLNLLLWNCWTKLNQTWKGWSSSHGLWPGELKRTITPKWVMGFPLKLQGM